MNLPGKLIAIHRALAAAGLPHAFGGAIALAYATSDPRGTSDIDVNIFVPAETAAVALEALPPEVGVPDDLAGRIARDGHARTWWDETPVDLFFDTIELHARAAESRRVVPFAGAEIPVLGPLELAVFKAMFDRTKDWADIEAMFAADTIVAQDVHDALRPLIDDDDPRHARLDEAARRAAG